MGFSGFLVVQTFNCQVIFYSGLKYGGYGQSEKSVWNFGVSSVLVTAAVQSGSKMGFALPGWRSFPTAGRSIWLYRSRTTRLCRQNIMPEMRVDLSKRETMLIWNIGCRHAVRIPMSTRARVCTAVNETVINPPAELGRLTDAGGGEQSIKIENSAV